MSFTQRTRARTAKRAASGHRASRIATGLAVICLTTAACGGGGGGGGGTATDANTSTGTLAPLSCANPEYSGYNSSTCQCSRGIASACPSGPNDIPTSTEPRRPEPEPRPEPPELPEKP